MEKGSLTRKQPIKNAYFLLTEVIGKEKKKKTRNLFSNQPGLQSIQQNAV